MGVAKQSLGVLYEVLVLEQFVEVKEVLEIFELLFVDLFLDDLDLCEDLVAGHDEVLLRLQVHHILVSDLFFQEGADDSLLLVHDLHEGHVDLDSLEPLGLLIDLLDGLQLLNDGVVLGERNVLNIDHNLIQRNIVATT